MPPNRVVRPMPFPRQDARFLARASVAIIGISALWWFLLLPPLLSVLKGSAELLAALAFRDTPCELVTETIPDAWHVCLPTQATVKNAAGAGFTRLSSIEFDMPRTDVYIFTFGLPVFCALMMAAARRGRWWRELVTGAVLTELLEVILFLLFLKTFAYGASSGHDAMSSWFVRFSQYFEVNVMPDVAPFLIALTVNGELRGKVVGWMSADPPGAASSTRGTTASQRISRKAAGIR